MRTAPAKETARPDGASPSVTGVNHITLAVHDIEESFRFYHQILGFKPIQKSSISAYLLAGDMWIALSKDSNARRVELPEWGDSIQWFI